MKITQKDIDNLENAKKHYCKKYFEYCKKYRGA